MKKSVFKLAAAECVLVCVILFYSGRLLFAQSSQFEKNNALFYAAASGTVDDVKAAIQNGADVNAKNDKGNTALMMLLDSNSNPDRNVIKALIVAGVNVNAKNNEGETALMFAVSNNHFDAAKLLIDGNLEKPYIFAKSYCNNRKT